MRIEKINENQIRCTLTKSDLEEHKMLLNELAFGSDNAKDLFRDMMAQASDEVGFEAGDIPLMIEAIPVSSEKLVLIITKMDNPEEFDDKFSKYMKPLEGLMDLDEEDSVVEADSTSSFEDSKEEKEIFSPFSQILNEAKKLAEKKLDSEKEHEKKNSHKLPETHRIYRFPSLAQAMDACQKIYPLYEGDNTLYKDPEDNFYYLVMARGNHSQEQFHQMGNILSEFGLRIPYSYGANAYFEEHFTKILESNAIQILASL
ncbi:MAG: adaptor protein MecA [Lachnospiraceae bacterium]|nr:adaptor protein MecA [Lachnospiraceae bacterium]